MVGYEPDFEKDWKKISKDGSDGEGSDNALTIEPTAEVVTTLSNPTLRPCNSPSDSCVMTPYHLRVTTTHDYKGCLTTPLIQVFSVRISPNIDVGEPCEIYGSIRAFEGSRPRFYLYDRGPADCETVGEDGALTLADARGGPIGPCGCAIIPFLNNSLDFHLRDRVQGVDLIKSKLELDPIDENLYDRLLMLDVPGPLAVAHVYYAVFQFAHYATVQVTVTKNDVDDHSCNTTDIYGTIVTGYANGRRYCNVDEDLKLLQTRLFDQQSRQPLRVMLGTPISLLRDVVVAPAYSTLTMEVNLWDSNHGRIAGETLNFPAHKYGRGPIHIRTQYACVAVLVEWYHSYLYLYNDRFVDDSDNGESSNNFEEMLKKPRVIYDQQSSSAYIPRKKPTVYFGFPKVEIFTVFVSGINEDISALCGAILIDDGGDKFSIYNRDDSCSELLPDNGLASIEVNYRAIDGCSFYVALFLKDPVGNREVSRGSFSWHHGSLESYMPWYSKRLCSIIRGDDGFAAVHYEVFSDAYEAFLVVKLLAEDHHDSPLNLYGSLFGLYSDHEYTTRYDKKYYKSRLFERERDRSVKVNVGSEIALLKSIVVVPNESSLIIEANLWVLGNDNVAVPISGNTEFEIDLSNTASEFIHGEHYKIEISVKFTDQADLLVA